MIEEVKGDLFRNNATHIAHGCNMQGVMGSGVAKIVKDKFPEAYNFYLQEYNNKSLRLGSILMVPSMNKTIINCMTQEFYGREIGKQYCSYIAIDECMNSIADIMKYYEDITLALPKIGCGLGGGDWNIVKEILSNNFKGLEDRVKVYYQ